MALFGMTAKEWRNKNKNLDGNIRDHATINELICLANRKNEIATPLVTQLS